ncbi:Vesicular glutamate transporter 3, partial [Fasciolopsis buskii]
YLCLHDGILQTVCLPFCHGSLTFSAAGILAFLWLPFWVIFVSETPNSHNWISVDEKNHIENSLKHTENGVLSAMPYIAGLIFTLLLAPVDSVMIRRRWLSIPRARKLWSSISAFGKSVLLSAIAFSTPESRTLIVALLVLNVMMSSVMLLGFNLADLDLAPPYAGMQRCCITSS